jgi:outer membrane receptor protein involved in Fe transport
VIDLPHSIPAGGGLKPAPRPVSRFPRKERSGVAALLAGLATLLPALILSGAPALAGTAGKLSGRVTDAKKAPLPGVTVLLVGARLGAFTDTDGRYTILNVPAGTYQVKFQLLGYRPVAVTDVQVNADNTTLANLSMEEAPVEMKEIVVSGKSPVVDVRQTSTIATVNKDQIAALPVQDLNDVVNLQAGVVDGHFRGGRIGEVQYQVDGISMNNSYDNSSTLRIDRSLIEEVQVISGTFDAEYGQAMSGVVNAVLKRGSKNLHWDGEAFSGGFVYPGHDVERQLDYAFRPTGIRNFQVSTTGPTPQKQTLFLASLQRYYFDDFVYGNRVFQTDGSFGDGTEVPLGQTREWSGVAKVSNSSIKNVEASYQAIFNTIDGQRTDYLYRYDPDGLSKQHTYSIVHGLDWTQTLSKKSFYNFGVRQNYFNYDDHAYEDLYDPRYDVAGPPHSNTDLNGAYDRGVSLTRFHQNTNALIFKGSFTSQITNDHQVKMGAEFQWPRLEFGNLGYLIPTNIGNRDTLLRVESDPSRQLPPLAVYHPVQGAAYAQEQTEWNDLALRVGLRLDYFDARTTVPSDLSNPGNTIEGAPESHPVPTTRKVTLSPRIGVSYPVSTRASLYFAYGHFYQLPGLGTIFNNADYSILSKLSAGQAVSSQIGTFGNPDLRPERTVQYQAGYKHAISENLGADVTVFYKDIRDLLGTEILTTYNDAQYTRLSNVDFGNVIGVTLSFDLRPKGLLGGNVDYTWQMAKGNTSDPYETATRAEAGLDANPHLIPFNWDQRHTLNLTATLARPTNWSASGIFRFASGQPYTPQGQFSGGTTENSGRKPNAYLLDLRGEKTLRASGFHMSLFARIFNVFDTRYFNGFVYPDTGSPYYSLFAQVPDPTRYYAPRRIELGLSASALK